MTVMNSGGYIGANRPWDEATHGDTSHDSRRGRALKYRGWVLVDLLNGRYARKGLQKVRVCNLHIQHSDAIKLFHKIVDDIEGEEEE
jgi:hypothetical protein